MKLGGIGKDLAAVVGLAIVSLIAGLIINHLGANSLPLVHRSPSERLQGELTRLVAAPPFESFPVETVSLDEFRPAVEHKDDLIIDARSSHYYQTGHVPGAINLARDDFARDYIRLRASLEKSKDAPIIVYCSGGDCHDSKMVAQALTSLGFSQVRVFTGGWDAWTAAGLPTERSDQVSQ
jgi:rhodanese-related sulfurtransferase